MTTEMKLSLNQATAKKIRISPSILIISAASNLSRNMPVQSKAAHIPMKIITLSVMTASIPEDAPCVKPMNL